MTQKANEAGAVRLLDPRITLSGDNLRLYFENGHSILIEPSEAGLAVILQVLKQRAMAERERIATPALPIQAMADEWLREAKRKALRRASTPEPGITLDLEGIDL